MPRIAGHGEHQEMTQALAPENPVKKEPRESAGSLPNDLRERLAAVLRSQRTGKAETRLPVPADVATLCPDARTGETAEDERRCLGWSDVETRTPANTEASVRAINGGDDDVADGQIGRKKNRETGDDAGSEMEESEGGRSEKDRKLGEGCGEESRRCGWEFSPEKLEKEFAPQILHCRLSGDQNVSNEIDKSDEIDEPGVKAPLTYKVPLLPPRPQHSLHTQPQSRGPSWSDSQRRRFRASERLPPRPPFSSHRPDFLGQRPESSLGRGWGFQIVMPDRSVKDAADLFVQLPAAPNERVIESVRLSHLLAAAESTREEAMQLRIERDALRHKLQELVRRSFSHPSWNRAPEDADS